MGAKKKGKKGSFVRPTVPNPLTRTGVLNEGEVDAIRSELKELLFKASPPTISKKAVVEAINKDDPEFKNVKGRRERRMRIKSKLREMREGGEHKVLLRHLCIGMRQSLKKLNMGIDVACLLYDPNVNFDSIKAVFDKGKFPIFAVRGLGHCVQEVTGFLASCVVVNTSFSEGGRWFPTIRRKAEVIKPVAEGCQSCAGEEAPSQSHRSTDKSTQKKEEAKLGSDFIKL